MTSFVCLLILAFLVTQGKAVHVKDLTKDVLALHDKNSRHWEDIMLHSAVVPYSALRDPIEKAVRIFFDAEEYLVPYLQHCYMVKGDLTGPDWRPESNEVDTGDGVLQLISHIPRRYSSYMLTCPDAGEEYDRFLFRSNETRSTNVTIMSVKITKVETSPLGVGWCMAVLYSARPGYQNWLQDTFANGIAAIHVYFTHVRDSRSITYFNGVNAGVGPEFEPIDFPNVRYYYYEPPVHTFYFSQTVMSNECMYRNRHAHKYLVMADSDEFLYIREPGITVEGLLQQLFQDRMASVSLSTLLYPLNCQPNNDSMLIWDQNMLEEEQLNINKAMSVRPDISLLKMCHMYHSTDVMWKPKAIINPRRVQHFRVHDVDAAEGGYEKMVEVNASAAYFKHIRPVDSCHSSFTKDLVDDSELSAYFLAKQKQDKR